MKKMPDYPVKEWHILPLEVCQKTLEEAKETFNELCSERESITNKSIKMLLGIVAFVSAIGNVILSKKIDSNFKSIVIIILTISFVYLLWSLYSILKSSGTYYRGSHPNDHMTNDYNKESFSADEKRNLVYVNLTIQYMFKIDQLKIFQRTRANKYDKNFRMSITLVIITSLFAALL